MGLESSQQQLLNAAAGQNASVSIGLEALVKEFMQEERGQNPWYIITPDSYKKSTWDAAVLLLVLVSAVSIPGQLAFSELLSVELSSALEAFHTVLLFVYGIDLCLWFFVSYQMHSGAWVFALDQIVANYCRTWLAVDLIAVVPWALHPWAAQGVPSVPALALVKVLRVSPRALSTKVGSSLGVTSVGGILMRFTRMFVGVFLLVHWFACVFFAASPADDATRPYVVHGSFSAGERYVFELYNALGMMLGERLDGEPDPKQAAVAMAAMLTGSLVIATVFGNVAVLITSFNMSKTRLQEKMDRINESMRSCHLPPELQGTVRQFYLYSWARHKESITTSFIDDLSPGLRRKVRLALYREVLVAVPIFKPLKEADLARIALTVSAEIYMPGDPIIIEGTEAKEMYVIGDGQVQVSRSDGLVVAVLGKGNFFGEMALFDEDLQRNCDVGALSICDIYRIATEHIRPVLDENPELQGQMLEIVNNRAAINANIDQKVQSLASTCRTGMMAADFKLRLQKRILQIQRVVQSTYHSPSSYEGGWRASNPEFAHRELLRNSLLVNSASRRSRAGRRSGGTRPSVHPSPFSLSASSSDSLDEKPKPQPVAGGGGGDDEAAATLQMRQRSVAACRLFGSAKVLPAVPLAPAALPRWASKAEAVWSAPPPAANGAAAAAAAKEEDPGEIAPALAWRFRFDRASTVSADESVHTASERNLCKAGSTPTVDSAPVVKAQSAVTELASAPAAGSVAVTITEHDGSSNGSPSPQGPTRLPALPGTPRD